MPKQLARTFLAICLIIATIAPEATAQTVRGSGGQGGQILRYGVGKALGMAGSFVSQADDASAGYWNPAGLGQLNQWQIAFMQSQLFLDTQYNFLAVTWPITSLKAWTQTLGVGVVSLGMVDFERTNRFNASDGFFDNNELVGMLSYSVSNIGSWGSANFGIKPQYYRQSIDGHPSSAFGVDLGLVLQPMSPRFLSFIPLKALMPWRIGANFRGWLSSPSGQDYPSSVNFGFGTSAFEYLFLDKIGTSKWPLKIVVSYEFEKLLGSKRPMRHYIGSDLKWRFGSAVILSGRIGYKLNTNEFEDRSGIWPDTFGFGLKSDADALTATPFLKGIELDFANVSHLELGQAYELFVTFKVGEWRSNVRRASRSVTNADNLLVKIDEVDRQLLDNGNSASANVDQLLDERRRTLAALQPIKTEYLRYMIEYARDDRVGEGNAVDLAYKDTVAARLSRIAEIEGKKFGRDTSGLITEALGPDKWLTKRYDEFIGGARKIDRELEKEWPTITLRNSGSLNRCDGDTAQFRAHFREYRDRYKAHLKDFEKEIYFRSLKWYLRVLLILGETEEVARLVQEDYEDQFEKHPRAKNYFLAYATKNPTYCDAVIQDGVPGDENPEVVRRYRPYEAWYMELAKAVYRVKNGQDATDANNLLSTNTLDVYISDVKKYDPLASICDGILADDIMFVMAYQQAQGLTDAKGIRDLFLRIVLELPHSDLGRSIAMRLTEMKDDRATKAVVDELWQAYEDLFMHNQVVDANSLLQYVPVVPTKESTEKR